jgi:hypothetical protein
MLVAAESPEKKINRITIDRIGSKFLKIETFDPRF